MEQEQDLVGVLVHDHDEVKELFEKIDSTDDPQQRRDFADQVTAELVRHSVAEEMYLYPPAREVLDDGDRMADDEIAEHAEAEKLLKQWEGMAGDDAQFRSVFYEVRRSVLAHIEEEEGELFPKLQQALSADALQELGEKVQAAKKIVPTRPHPSAPDTPPWNKVLGPGAGIVDRVRDKLSGRNTG